MAAAMTVLNLERARKQCGVSLEAIAETTKISSRFLRAIESEEFEKLPGGVFNTSYIRQYAAAIGISENQILNLYTSRMEPEESPTLADPQMMRRRGLRGWLLNLSPVRF
jgi:cytoskeletal protein RodZ